LSEEGMALQVMVPNPENEKELIIKNIRVPFGSGFLLRADIPHAGCYGSENNARLQAALIPKSTKGYKEKDLGYVHRKDLREAGFTVKRETEPKLTPELMLVGSKSILAGYIEGTYWKMYLQSNKGRISKARAARFKVHDDSVTDLKKKLKNEDYLEEVVTDYEVETDDEEESKNPQVWRGQIVEENRTKFGHPKLLLM
jgi:hypothetical protein